MKILTIIAAFLLVHCNHAAGQLDSSKFSVQLPDEWKAKSNFLYKLTQLIETHIIELDNKRICFDCNAAYLVKFYVSAAEVDHMYYHQTSNFIFTTTFGFYAYMDVLDTGGRILHRLVINDSSTMHNLTYRLDGRGYKMPPIQNRIGQLKENALAPLENGQRNTQVNVPERIGNMTALANQFDDNCLTLK